MRCRLGLLDEDWTLVSNGRGRLRCEWVTMKDFDCLPHSRTLACLPTSTDRATRICGVARDDEHVDRALVRATWNLEASKFVKI